MIICYIMNMCLVMFLREEESQCCGVLVKHCRKLKGEQVITLQMVQQLKAKNINVIQAQLLCCHFKAKEAEACKVQFNCLEDSESDSYD